MVRKVALVLLMLSVSVSVSAQSYARQVWDQLQSVYNEVSDSSSFELNNYIIGKLPQGRTDSWTFPLQRGREYLIIGVCDNDCDDVDLTVKDADGRVIVRDEETDDTPVARFRVTGSGRFQVEVGMHSCKDEPCFFGFGLFEK